MTMLMIIKRIPGTAAQGDVVHEIQSQSHRTENWLGEDWIAVPEHLREKVWETCGYCDLVIEDDALTDVLPRPIPEPPPAAPDPLTELTAQVAAMQARIDELELGQEAVRVQLSAEFGVELGGRQYK